MSWKEEAFELLYIEVMCHSQNWRMALICVGQWTIRPAIDGVIPSLRVFSELDPVLLRLTALPERCLETQSRNLCLLHINNSPLNLMVEALIHVEHVGRNLRSCPLCFFVISRVNLKIWGWDFKMIILNQTVWGHDFYHFTFNYRIQCYLGVL